MSCYCASISSLAGCVSSRAFFDHPYQLHFAAEKLVARRGRLKQSGVFPSTCRRWAPVGLSSCWCKYFHPRYVISHAFFPPLALPFNCCVAFCLSLAGRLPIHASSLSLHVGGSMPFTPILRPTRPATTSPSTSTSKGVVGIGTRYSCDP